MSPVVACRLSPVTKLQYRPSDVPVSRVDFKKYPHIVSLSSIWHVDFKKGCDATSNSNIKGHKRSTPMTKS